MTSVSEALSYTDDAIGIGRKGTIDSPYILRAPFWTVDTLFYSIPCRETDLDFAFCLFLNINWKAKDESSGLPSLSKREINLTVVRIPRPKEQRAIGAFFRDLDDLIALHQREHVVVCGSRRLSGFLLADIRSAGDNSNQMPIC